MRTFSFFFSLKRKRNWIAFYHFLIELIYFKGIVKEEIVKINKRKKIIVKK